MHPDSAAARVGAAHDFIANFVDEHGKGEFAEKVRKLRINEGLSPAAREVRDAEAMAALVEMMAEKMSKPDAKATKKASSKK